MLSEIDQFVNWVRRRNSEARTWKDYRYDLRQFAALVGDVPPGTITFREVDRFVDLQKPRGFLPTTINRRLASLISFYTFLSDDDPDIVCPVLLRRHNLRERERLPRPVQEVGLRAFFAAIETTVSTKKGEPDNRVRDRAMFILMLGADGARVYPTRKMSFSLFGCSQGRRQRAEAHSEECKTLCPDYRPARRSGCSPAEPYPPR